MPKEVTFTGNRKGDAVAVRTLIGVLEKALKWLRGRDEDETVDWEVIRVALGNPISLTFRSETANGPLSARMTHLHSMQNKRAPKTMPRLTDDDIDATIELSSVLDEQFSSLKISSSHEPTVRFTPALIERVEHLAKTTKRFYYEHTTIRGTLYEVTAMEGGTHRFKIVNASNGVRIPCNFPTDEFHKVREAMKHRVEVSGLAKCSGHGEIKSIDNVRFRVLADNPKPFTEMPSIDITGGLSTVEHIERVRGGY